MYVCILSGTSVAPTSQVRTSAMLVLSIVGNRKYEFGVTFNVVTSVLNLIKIYPAVLELKDADKGDYPKVCSFRAHGAKNA
jgi:hypothetical protein